MSGYESKWGAGDYIAPNGPFTGNAFFSLEAEVPQQDSPRPPLLWDSTGWSQPSSQKNQDNMYAIVAGYASYYDAAMGFVNKFGGMFYGVTDPTQFAKIATSAYGINVATFVSIVNTLVTRCM